MAAKLVQYFRTAGSISRVKTPVGLPLPRNLHNHFPSRLDFPLPWADLTAAGFSTRLNWSHTARISTQQFVPHYGGFTQLYLLFGPNNRSRRFDGIEVGRKFCSFMRNVRVTPVAGYGLLLRSLPVLRRQHYINIAAMHRNTSNRVKNVASIIMS